MCNTCGCKKAESFEAETKFVKSLSNKDIDRIFRYLWDNSQMTAEYWFKKSSDAEKKKIYKITQDDMDAETFEAETKFVKSLSNKDIDRIFRYLWDNSQMTAEYWFKKSSDAEKKKIYEITQDDMDAETFEADSKCDRLWDCKTCERCKSHCGCGNYKKLKRTNMRKMYGKNIFTPDTRCGFDAETFEADAHGDWLTCKDCYADRFIVSGVADDYTPECNACGSRNLAIMSQAEEFDADFDNAPYDSFDEAMSDNVSFPEKEYEIDDRDIYNPDRAAMDMIRGNRALREEMEEQGVYVGRHPGYYNDNGQWVELMEHYDDYERIPNWLQGLVGVGLVGGLTYLLTKISGSTTDAGNNTTESTE
jgi:predicted DCC family thiol-disulfide oxidoreductase YuxK